MSGIEPTARTDGADEGCPACLGQLGPVTRTAPDVHRPWDLRTYALRTCPTCGLVLQHPMPSRAELASAYAVAYAPYRACWSTPGWPVWKLLRTATIARRLRWLPPAWPGGRLLEVGCGAGDFLLAARRAGWSVVAVEYAPEVAARVRRGSGLAVTTGELTPGLWPEASFDIVVLWDVLEHVPDPLETLRLVATYLRPGGLAVMSLPTAAAVHAGKWLDEDWAILDLPRHLTFVTRRSLEHWLGAAGLECVAYDTPLVDTLWLYVLSAARHVIGPRGFRTRAARAIRLASHLIPDAVGLALGAMRAQGLQAFVVARRAVAGAAGRPGAGAIHDRGD